MKKVKENVKEQKEINRISIRYSLSSKIKDSRAGITLIALVITIIVLLILAAVTIATLTGENGILTQANKAKTSNTEGEASEQFALLANEWAIEKNTGSKTLGEFLNEKITEGKITSIKDNEDGTYTIKLNGYQTIINENGKISSVFNPEEWDKTATPEDCFIWGSDTEGEEGYDVIIGYTDKLESYTKLIIPSRCTKIDLNTSYTNTASQSSRSFGHSVKAIEIPSTVVEIGSYAFTSSNYTTGFDNLESITIPESVITIGSGAFWFCKSLNNVTIPDSVTSIGWNAFASCTSLSNIKFPSSVKSVGDNAFYDTAWYNNQPDGVVYAGKVVCGYKGTMSSDTSIQIKEGTTLIADRVFVNCHNLTSITIPNSVTSIGQSSFECCINLSNITIPNSVTSIGHWAFSSCNGLTSLRIPSSVSTMGDFAFDNWTSSQTINIQGYTSAPSGWNSAWNQGCSATINWGQ